MKYPVKIYIITSVICFLVLAIVQCVLVYNTYDLLNRRFFYEKKGKIQQRYTRAIINDKLFPGGQQIIDSAITPQYRRLEALYLADTVAFNRETELLLNNLFATLVRKQNADSLLKDIKAKEGITDSLRYALSIQRIDLMFSDMKYVTIYDRKHRYDLIDPDIQRENGIRIFGDLPFIDEQNKVLSLNISTPEVYSYAISFTFHADPYNRRELVLGQMRLMLTMSLLSMLAIITLFFITLRNWIKQKHLSDVKTDFINNITHEFHTPLSAIMVANKNIQNERIQENKTALQALSEVIDRQSLRLKLLIGQVLDIATVDKLTLRKQQHDLGLLVTEILTDFSLKFSDSNVELNFTEHANNSIVEVDSFHFTTLLLNILDNAVKYNTQEIKKIDVSIQPDKESIQLIISDNGIGMTKETMKHIFDKFYRQQKDLTQQAKGLGLGLHYVKQCIEAHQWKLNVESEPGKGSTFVIIIPT